MTIPVAVGTGVEVAVGGMGVGVPVGVGTGVEVSVGLAVDVGISAFEPCTGAVRKLHARITPTKNRLIRITILGIFFMVSLP